MPIFHTGSVGARKIETTNIFLSRMQVFTNSEEAEWIAEVVDRIETYSNKGDAILALPYQPHFLFSDRSSESNCLRLGSSGDVGRAGRKTNGGVIGTG